MYLFSAIVNINSIEVMHSDKTAFAYKLKSFTYSLLSGNKNTITTTDFLSDRLVVLINDCKVCLR